MRKISTALLLGALLWVPSTAYADAYDPLALPLGSNNLMEYVVENGAIQNYSFIAIQPPAVTSVDQPRGRWKWCTSLKDPICDPANNPANFAAVTVFAPCQSAAQENCIDSLSMGTTFTKLSSAQFVRTTAGTTFPSDPTYNYPGSSTISLWNAPGLTNGGNTSTYAVTVVAHMYLQNGLLHMGDFYAGVEPYSQISGSFHQRSLNLDPNVAPEDKMIEADNFSCVYEENGDCGVAQDFAPHTVVALKVRLSHEVGGWFSGRLQNPSMSVTPVSQTSNVVTITGEPAVVPRLALGLNTANFTAQQRVWYQNNGYWPDGSGQGSGPRADVPTDAFPTIDYYRTALKDTATGVNSFWNVQTVSNGNGSSCLQDTSQLLGLVTTNAMSYDGSSPSFDNETLNYHVAGLHFMPDGTTPVSGAYSLVMRSSVARCLYGFSQAPIKADISIVGNGSTTVATTITKEENGWLTLSAAGFTFSDKTIQIKLTQPDSAATTPTPQGSASGVVQSAKPQVKVISCIKGKTMKKVSSTIPVCPPGYKRK